MPGKIPAVGRETWRFRLWRLLTLWEAALDSDPIECLEQRVSALERDMHSVPLQRTDITSGGKPSS
jgi:hypothetical protein